MRKPSGPVSTNIELKWSFLTGKRKRVVCCGGGKWPGPFSHNKPSLVLLVHSPSAHFSSQSPSSLPYSPLRNGSWLWRIPNQHGPGPYTLNSHEISLKSVSQPGPRREHTLQQHWCWSLGTIQSDVAAQQQAAWGATWTFSVSTPVWAPCQGNSRQDYLLFLGKSFDWQSNLGSDLIDHLLLWPICFSFWTSLYWVSVPRNATLGASSYTLLFSNSSDISLPITPLFMTL